VGCAVASRIRCHHPGEAVTVLRSDHPLRKVTRGACIERDPGAEERFCGGGAHARCEKCGAILCERHTPEDPMMATEAGR
jgi:hypothetical protein